MVDAFLIESSDRFWCRFSENFNVRPLTRQPPENEIHRTRIRSISRHGCEHHNTFSTSLTFVIIAVFGWSRPVDIALIFTIAGIFILDALDGYIVRKRNETTTLGEVLDTLADRIVENTFWIYFTASGHLNVWMPIAVMARGFLTDSLQRFWGYPQKGWTHALTRSRVSRAMSGITKMLDFTSVASVAVFNHDTLETVSLILATLAVGFCLLRGLPFFFITSPTPKLSK